MTAGVYQAALQKRGIACDAGAGGDLLQTAEVEILLQLLQIIDNPRRDIPLAAAMASPVFGFAPEELAHLQDYIAGSNSDYTSIGLRNTHCRLELFFGKPYGLSIRSVPGRGTSVTLRMPLMHKPFA